MTKYTSPRLVNKSRLVVEAAMNNATIKVSKKPTAGALKHSRSPRSEAVVVRTALLTRLSLSIIVLGTFPNS
ncbi:hypothetical protein T11_5662 [Trichinella zimbabwensis]|uniref:Uncharacterized protein n=1 Tax=Trichinella zimbabwensis TaxID=268475 RepID=A0A0V1HNT4_9BILA|nr:hypothetical protein T11_5662 [Trichinella zimbabwensis]